MRATHVWSYHLIWVRYSFAQEVYNVSVFQVHIQMQKTLIFKQRSCFYDLLCPSARPSVGPSGGRQPLAYWPLPQ